MLPLFTCVHANHLADEALAMALCDPVQEANHRRRLRGGHGCSQRVMSFPAIRSCSVPEHAPCPWHPQQRHHLANPSEPPRSPQGLGPTNQLKKSCLFRVFFGFFLKEKCFSGEPVTSPCRLAGGMLVIGCRRFKIAHLK